MKDKSHTLCYSSNFLLSPTIRWIYSHLSARTTVKLKVKETASPECCGHHQLSPLLQKLTKHQLTSMVSPIIPARSIQN